MNQILINTHQRCCNNRDGNKITHIPYYGGAKGNLLEVIEAPDGTITTNIIKAKVTEPKPESEFANNIKHIHQAALDIIKLHEETKHKGELNAEEKERYDKGIEQLNESSKHLAQYQTDNQGSEERSNLQFWFEKKKQKFGLKENAEDGGNKEEDKEDVGEEGDGDGDGVAINLPPPDASVAEAKPVGLAIAGLGGVAASKPIATAVVGPGGLAIARPVATAIAGVAPEEALVPLTGDGYYRIPEKKKDSNKCSGRKCSTDKEKPKKDEEEVYDYYGNFKIKSFYR